MISLGDAMRAGATKGGQLSGVLLDEYGNSCAMGAVLLGAGIARLGAERSMWDTYPKAKEMYPQLNTSVKHPFPDAPGTTETTLLGTIVDLNNRCGWTREMIADFVDQFDPARAVVAASEPIAAEPTPIHQHEEELELVGA